MGVNNLPKVATLQRGGRGSNSRPLSHQSDALATRLSMRLSFVQIDDVGGRQYTYSQLVEHVHDCATSLGQLGLRLGQRVCLFMPNCIEYPLACLAILRLGAICAPINPAATKCMHLLCALGTQS